MALFCVNEAMAGSFKDRRDGKKYETVKIGRQTWMAENLNYKMEDSYCNPENNCGDGYGRLYTWDAALNACPSGWRLPSKTDFEKLLAFVKGIDAYGDDESAARHLRFKYDWTTKVGDNASGFSVLPAGRYEHFAEKFAFLGEAANFWSSTEDGSSLAHLLYVNGYKAAVGPYYKASWVSVRCLQD
ncbi:MAG: hypothetical protein MJZ26_00890 [Fibrobacter sp.]|nr:hypothetical protein [Fibrobacter sp.]